MFDLSKVTQSIVFGNGEVWNFLDYVVNRELGGLLSYTQKNDYLGKNFINNFNGGFERRYGYNDITNTESYAIDRTRGGLRGSPRGFGGNMGELYEVPETFNSELKFITKKEYVEMQRKIRGLNLIKKSDSNYIQYVPEFYAGEVSDEYKTTNLSSKNLGDDVDIRYIEDINALKQYTLLDFGIKAKDASDRYLKIVKNKIRNNSLFPGLYHYIIESYNGTEPISLSEDRYKVRKINEEGRIYKVLKPLLSVASEKREQSSPEERKLLTKYFEGSLNPDGYKVTVNDEGYGEVLIDTKKHVLSEYINKNNGLYAYYSEERKKYKSSLEGIKNPWGNKSLWNNENSYGVEFKEKGQEYYSVNEENKYNGDAQISILYNGGGHSKFVDNTRVYDFYQEKEGVGNLSLKSTSVVDGSSVSLSDYNSASRLLQKTNKLFSEGKIQSLVNRFHTDIKEGYDELTTSYDETYGISRGRNLLSRDGNGKVIVDKSYGYENPYCRTWTAHYQYSKLKDRIRPFVKDGESISIKDTQSNYGDLRPKNGSDLLNKHSVLGANGYVNITPTHNNNTIKNFMFSIENLAWRDIKKDVLSKEQQGPRGGRIMWFPPYNLKFTENVNVNWNTNTFIGRGEDIYTYINTTRSGTLDFTLLIDHPSVLNKWRGTGSVDDKIKKEQELLRFFAGCENLNDSLPPVEKEEVEEKEIEQSPTTTPEPKSDTKKIAYVMFFPNLYSGYNNARSDIEKSIETLSKYNKGGVISDRDKDYEKQNVGKHNEQCNGLTSSDYDETMIRNILFGGDDKVEIKYFDDLLDIQSNIKGDEIFGFKGGKCEISTIEVKGFASSHGTDAINKVLCKRRRETIKLIMKHVSSYFSGMEYRDNDKGCIISVQKVDGRNSVNAKDAKLARAAYAIVEIKWSEENTATPAVNEEAESSVNGVELDSQDEKANVEESTNVQTSVTVEDGVYTYDNEYLYFSEIDNDSLIHKNIVDKVRYFDPAFHSITPEGFNARLTFLHQCTRQGPTDMGDTKSSYVDFAGNLSFGRAPYCVLRIGDFFNTKICIDSISITYDNNGVQWDLNPEGIGVQPMFANVSISFKFIGGQDISNPIERLQNAVTANYYANASVYSRHADNEKEYYNATDNKFHSK